MIFYGNIKEDLSSNEKLAFFVGLIFFSVPAIFNLFSLIDPDYITLNQPKLDPVLTFENKQGKLFISFIIKNLGNFPANNILICYDTKYEKRIDTSVKNNILNSGTVIKINLLPINLLDFEHYTNPIKLLINFECEIKNSKYEFNSYYTFPYIDTDQTNGLLNYYYSGINKKKFNEKKIHKDYKIKETLNGDVGSFVFNIDENKQSNEHISIMIKSESKRIFYDPISKEIIFEWDINSEETMVNRCVLDYEDDHEKTIHKIIIIWSKEKTPIYSDLYVSKDKFSHVEFDKN